MAVKSWVAAVALVLGATIACKAGGQEAGRAGIIGDPIPLESKDPRHRAYFEEVQKRIKAKWGFPCVKAVENCEMKTTELDVQFGITTDGSVAFVDVTRPSPWPIYNDYAVNAIKQGAPFPPVPDAILQGNGIPIIAKFRYVVDRSLTEGLRLR